MKDQIYKAGWGDGGLEFLDVKLKMTNGEISFDVFSKPINIVLLSTCYPKKSRKCTQRNGLEIKDF